MPKTVDVTSDTANLDRRMAKLDPDLALSISIQRDVEAGIRSRGRLDRIVALLGRTPIASNCTRADHVALVLDLLAGAGVHTPGWVRGEMTQEAASRRHKKSTGKKPVLTGR